MTIFKDAYQRFRDDRRGNVAIIFAGMAIPAVLATGMAIDYGRAVYVRANLKAAADAAALAAAGAGTAGNTVKLALAAKVFNANSKFGSAGNGAGGGAGNGAGGTASGGQTNEITVSQSTVIDVGSVLVTATAAVPTPFLRIAHINSIPIEVKSRVQTAGKTLEVALMLDVTGSMGGKKLTDLKFAAKDFMDIVMPTGGAGSPTKIALVPFSNRVAVGATYASVLTGQAPTKYGYPLRGCVTERQGSYRYSDAAPGPNKYIGKYQPGYGWNYNYWYNSRCEVYGRRLAEIKPLSTDRTMLRNHINSFQAAGGTAGHLGTAFAWYMVSPKWNSVWPAASQSKAYDDQTNIKAVILMTDGQYNTSYTSGLSSTTMARHLCTKMKQAGVVVYTVGFGIPQGSSTQRNTLIQCASGPNHYFFPYNGTELRTAFRSIGQALSYAQGSAHLVQ